jgi:membrane protease YdiL (CAAX protease family)
VSVGAVSPAQAAPQVGHGAAVVAVLACGLLLARPWLIDLPFPPTLVLVALFLGLGLAAARWPLPIDRPAPLVTAAVALTVGLAAFALGRGLAGGVAVARLVPTAVLLNTLAAVAEEALFRRLLYGALLRWGAPIAVVGSAAAFAVVHLTVWGAWVLPLDFAAGLVLSWQRWVSGRWSVAAVTHSAANVMALL